MIGGGRHVQNRPCGDDAAGPSSYIWNLGGVRLTYEGIDQAHHDTMGGDSAGPPVFLEVG